MITDKEINEELEAKGLTRSQLTDAELYLLKAELEAKEKGQVVLDGVLNNPEIYYRHLKKQ